MKSQTWFFLRGLVRESRHWGDFLTLFAAAFPGRKIVTLDLPGTGQRYRETSPATVMGMVNRLRPEFLERKGEDNFLFAVSLGAMVGIEWLDKNPEDFKGAVLLNTSVKGISPFYERLLPATYPGVLKLFLSRSTLAKEKEILRLTSNLREDHAAVAEAWAAVAAECPVAKSNALRQLFAATRYSPPAKAPKNNILLLNSAGDRLCSPRCSEKLARAWNLPLKTHPNAGHDLTLDDPNWVVSQLQNFSV
ncbi:MAG: alpha/beta fold hydrolase [Bdellovibrionota bacterium]